MSTVEELTGIVAGLMSVVKDLTQNVNHVTSQVGQLAATAAQPGTVPLAVNQATPSLRLPTLQLPTFRCDEEQRNDIADFLERFTQQTSHLTDELKTTLLEQQCVGDWPRSVLSIAKTTTGFAEKTAKEQFDIFTDSLKREFEEPKSVKCRRLASELSSMHQHDDENVDQFTFRFKNVLHQLEKLGERVAKDCPTYVISQFISKVKPEIAQHLALKAEELTTLDKAVESARRVELSFCQHADNGNSTAPQSLASWKPSSALFTSPPDKSKLRFARKNVKKRECWTCGSSSHVARNCTSQKTEHMNSNKPEICRNFNRRLHSTCEKANNKCTHGRLHKCSACNKWGCKAVRHESQQANAATAVNQPASPPNTPVSSNETLFGLPAFTDPTAVPANTQTQVGNRNILWTSVISAGKSLPLPLDSCCSMSLVSADHAQIVITERPLLQYKTLAEPIPVSVADAKANLTATAVMDIPIKWNNGKDCVFTMLVVPRLTWPILFGENHLHATKALVDHAEPSVTFRHPSMQFSVQCSLDNPLKGFANSTLPASQVTSSSDPTGISAPHVGVTCLLTDAPLPGQPKGSTSLQRGLNLVTVCLTLSSVFVGFRGTNPSLWLEGQEVQPGIKVLSGPFDWQSAQSSVIPKEPPGAVCHASLCDIQEDQCQRPETEEIPDFTSVYYTTVAIECKQKHSSLPQNVILGHIRPPTAQDQEIFQQAADTTSEQLAEAWMTWAETQTQPKLSTCKSKANTTRPTPHDQYVSGKQPTPQSEMQAAGLDSSILSPFREPVELVQDTVEFLPDTAHESLDPYSEEWVNAVVHQLTKLLSIDHVFTTSYRPRLNGSTERVHRWLNSAIAIYCNKYQSNWQDFLQPAVYTHNVSPIPGTGKISPFFLVFGRHAPSPETLILNLPPHPLPKQTYAENLVLRIGEAQKHFNRIKADIKRSQREHYDQSSRNIEVDVGMRVYVRKPPPTNQPKGLTPRFTRRFDGPFMVTEHVHGRQDLLRLRHETTGQEMRTVNIEKIVVVPEGDPHDIRPEDEQPVQASNEPQVTTTPVSPDLAKVASTSVAYQSPKRMSLKHVKQFMKPYQMPETFSPVAANLKDLSQSAPISR